MATMVEGTQRCAQPSLADSFACLGFSPDRRHGDPFPLPRLLGGSRPNDKECNSTFANSQSTLPQLVDEAASALNALASVKVSTSHSRPPPTLVQRAVIDSLGERIRAVGECPPDLSPDAALGELLDGQSHEYHMKAKHLASYDIRKIKVLQRDFRPQRALDLMPPEPLAYLKNFQQCIEKSERQIEVSKRVSSHTSKSSSCYTCLLC